MGIFDFNGGRPPNNPPKTDDQRAPERLHSLQEAARTEANAAQAEAQMRAMGALNARSIGEWALVNSNSIFQDPLHVITSTRLSDPSLLYEAAQKQRKEEQLRELNETNGYMMAALDVCVDLMAARFGEKWFALADTDKETRMALDRLRSAGRLEVTATGFARIIPNK